MTYHRLVLLACCSALATLVMAPSGRAFAQSFDDGVDSARPRAPGEPAATDQAAVAKHRELFEKGNQLYDAGKLQDAEAVYLEAWRLKKTYDVAGNLGNVELDLGKWRSAAEYLAYAIREFPAGGKTAARDALLRRIGEAQQRIGMLRLVANKPGAELSVDGVVVGRAPLATEVYVVPGSHLIEARLEGYPSTRRTIAIEQGGQQDVSLELTPKKANRTILLAGGAVAGTAAVAGVVFAVLASSHASTASKQRDTLARSGGCGAAAAASTASPACQDLESEIRAKAGLGSAAVWSFVGAGAVGAGTLAYGLVAPKMTKTGVRVLPLMTAAGAGLVVGGAF